MTAATSVQTKASVKHNSVRILGWSALAALGGAAIYSVFSILTGMEPSLIGVAVGLGIGQSMYYASGKHGGRMFQNLTVIVAFVAFDLTYGPRMAGVSSKEGVTVPTLS